IAGVPGQMLVGGLVQVAAMLPLAWALAERVEGSVDRRYAIVSIALCSGARALFGVTYVIDPLRRDVNGDIRWALTSAIPLIPGLIAAGPIDFRAVAGQRGVGGLVRSTELALAGATP